MVTQIEPPIGTHYIRNGKYRLPVETILWDDNFDGPSLNGWTGLFAAETPDRYPQIATEYSAQGAYSMMLDVDRTLGSFESSAKSAVATKRAAYHEGKVALHTRFAWTAKATANLQELRFIIDTQDWSDNRRWYEVRYQHTDTSSAQVQNWQVTLGGGATNYTDLKFNRPIDWNAEVKNNFHDLTFIVVPESGRFDRMIYDGYSVSLSSLAPSTTAFEADFTGGLTAVYYVTNRSNVSSSDPRLYIDRTTAAVLGG